MAKLTIPENFKLVQLANPKTTNGGFTSDYISLKNVKRATIIIDNTQAVGHATAFTLGQASAVDGTGAKALTNVTSCWLNDDVATSDTLVKQTDAKAVTVTADVKNKQIVFQVDPCQSMDLANGFDCLYFTAADSSQATNFASAVAILEMRYAEDTPPAAITD